MSLTLTVLPMKGAHEGGAGPDDSSGAVDADSPAAASASSPPKAAEAAPAEPKDDWESDGDSEAEEVAGAAGKEEEDGSVPSASTGAAVYSVGAPSSASHRVADDDDSDYDSDFDGEEDEEDGWEPSALDEFKMWLEGWLDSTGATVFMTVLTIYALFGDDIRILSAPAGADVVFEIVSSICFFIFLLELVLNTWAKTYIFCDRQLPQGFLIHGFLFSFFWWLDLVAAASLMPEMPWLWGPLTGISEGNGGSLDLSTTRATRLSRAGSKAGRIIRMVRLVRLVKLYKFATHAASRSGDGSSDGDETLHVVKESRVGATLSKHTTQRVITGVLIMLICVPLFSVEEVDNSPLFATQFLHSASVEQSPMLGDTLQQYEQFFRVWPDSDTPRLLFLELYDSQPVPLLSDYDALRDNAFSEEVVKYALASKNDSGVLYTTTAWFNNKPVAQDAALLSMLLTLFICVLLAVGAYIFTSDAQLLVLRPIEEMVDIVEQLVADPFKQLDGEESGGMFEAKLLEDTIKMISGLLRVGFGEAGADIISRNLMVGEELDALTPGRRMYSIFGFCDIRNFEVVTEVLKEDIMLFVNRIASIVHGCTIAHGGAVNKNIGNAFLLVWRLDLEESSVAAVESTPAKKKEATGKRRSSRTRRASLERRDELLGRRSSTTARRGSRRRSSGARRFSGAVPEADLAAIPGATDAAESALAAFLHTIAALRESAEVAAYREHDGLQAALPGYQVDMGFGLHAGWAIEGAIGSKFKVDASYLSPHVNMAARMEAATRQYGVSVLMTGDFARLLSEETRGLCRRLDVVTVKGSVLPQPLYTYDTPQTEEEQAAFDTAIKEARAAGDVSSHERSRPASNATLTALRAHIGSEWREAFAMALAAYEDGMWEDAVRQLEALAEERPHDQPTQVLMQYMRNYDCSSPAEWMGFRGLTSK